ncbi:MAG: LysR substrate-binding domain-containing protein [Polyangiales bacterium]
MQRTGILELNAVVAVATHRSFRAAADELELSRSALSHMIAALERRIGVRLFQRTTRSVALTPAGEHFLGRIRPALRELSEAVESVSAFRDSLTGTLRINASEGALRLFMMPLVCEFLRRYPDMQLDIATTDGLVDIVAAGFDAGVRLAEDVPKDMIAVPCAPDVSFAVVGAPAYFAAKGRKRPQHPNELRDHVCIRRRWPSGAIYRWEFTKRRSTLAVDTRGSLTLDQDEPMRQAACEGLGLAYLDEWSVAGDLASGRLVRVLADWTPRYAGPRLFYPSHRHVPASLHAFVALVRERHKVRTTRAP